MADLDQLRAGRQQTERTSWMTVKWWAGTEAEGQPIASGDGVVWEIEVKNAQCAAFQKALDDFQLQRRARMNVLQSHTNGQPLDPSQVVVGVVNEYNDFEAQKFKELLIVNWRGLTEDGEDIPCNAVNIQKYVFDEFPRVFTQVRDYAFDGRNYGDKRATVAVVDPVTEIEKKPLPGVTTDSPPVLGDEAQTVASLTA